MKEIVNSVFVKLTLYSGFCELLVNASEVEAYEEIPDRSRECRTTVHMKSGKSHQVRETSQQILEAFDKLLSGAKK